MRLIFVLLAMTMLLNCAWSKENNYFKFERINVNDGLSHRFSTDIFQDSKGFMWFGTRDGLNRYDGRSIKIYKHKQGDSLSISSNTVLCITEDSKKNLWLGLEENGIAKYNRDLDNFINYKQFSLNGQTVNLGTVNKFYEDSKHNLWIGSQDGLIRLKSDSSSFDHFLPNEKPFSLKGKIIRAIAEDENGNIWIGTTDGGLNIFENATQKFLNLSNSPELFNSIGQVRIWSIFGNQNSDMWIGTEEKGLIKYDKNFKKFIAIGEQSHELSLLKNQVNYVLQDSKGWLWVSLHNMGLCIYHPTTNKLTWLVHDDLNPNSLHSNSIYSIFEDKSKVIWLASYGDGVGYYTNSNFFDHIHRFSNKDQSLSHNYVNTFLELAPNKIWIGTDGGGINVFNRSTNSFVGYYTTKSKPALSNDHILSLTKISESEIMIGTWGGGINIYDANRNAIHYYTTNTADSYALPGNKVLYSYMDSQKRVWVSTFESGVSIFDRSSGRFYNNSNSHDRHIFPHLLYVKHIAEEAIGTLWFAGYDGLCRLNGTSLTSFKYNESDPNSLPNNNINQVYIDTRKNVWIATMGGLCRFNPSTNNFIRFEQIDEIANNAVMGIIEDNSGFLWLSTNSGLLKFDPNSLTVKKYTKSDGLQDNQFHEKSCFRSSNWELYFGGYNGFNVFHPDDIKENKYVPPVLITDLKINSIAQIPGTKHSVLDRNITETEQIILKHKQNSLVINYIALNYISSIKNKYSYMLEGFDENWVEGNETNSATYTNLSPGKYTFRVKASNNDGCWNEKGANLKIEVLPPFYKTRFAFFLYIFTFLVGLFVYRRYILIKERIKTSIQNEKLQAQQQHELDNSKLKFFTNISHEFKTPLTLIMSPLEGLLKIEEIEEKRKQLNLIHRNAQKLFHLINQLMEFRKIELGKLDINETSGDLVLFLNSIFEAFKEVATQKNINYAFYSNLRHAYLLFDHDKLDKIIYNLLSNAFKFTPQHGIINFHVTFSQVANNKQSLKIMIKDTGAGIAENDKEHIFDRFYQADEVKNTGQGTGIGLALAKELIDVLNAKIELESQLGEGSCFTVFLNLKVAAKTDIQEKDAIDHGSITQHQILDNASLANFEQGKTLQSTRKTILIVEDNYDLLNFLTDQLKTEFTIINALNGASGWEETIKEFPDLIISDIMMPLMNGIELCKKIKTDERTSHIPVVLLTAKSSEESQLFGFEEGADEYILKPFNFDILLVRIRNILRSRDLLKRKFSNQIDISPKDIATTNVDQNFVKKVLDLVDENISNPNFSVETLSEKIGMSRSNLYRKLFALSGKTPTEFIRIMKLKRACQLLQKTDLPISQIAFEVGFNDQAHFRELFKKEYNCLPSEYAQKHRSNE
jgi:signal transduction histidine kinase/ligand-binding sensor domain-containing protein/DNA-binding response OmpR family regulator